MKKLIITSILAVLVTAGTIVRGQGLPEEYLGLPGDNLNLYAVMKLFQDSKTLEEFERNLNDKESMINNLDLNGDGFVDYITVTDYVDGKIHTIVLRAVLGRDDYQDVAVFIVEIKNKNKVRIQLIGDEALYGKNYIIEPRSETPNPGYKEEVLYGNNSTVVIIGDDYYYGLYGWPLIDYMYMPGYVAWHSNWYWGYWPVYWHPWRPWYWHYYYGYYYHWYPYYYEWYRHWDRSWYPHYNSFNYGSVRAHSPQVEQRINTGSYRETYSRPDQMDQGETRYASMHLSNTRSIRSEVTVSQPAGRTSAPQSTRTAPAATGTVSPRRSVPAVSSGEVRNTETGSRSSVTTDSRKEAVTAGERSNGVSRRSEVTVEKAPATPAVTESAPASRSSYEAPATVQRQASRVTAAPQSAPAVHSSGTRSAETRSSATADKSTSASQKSSNKEETSTPRSPRR
jgi:hypothetical protein